MDTAGNRPHVLPWPIIQKQKSPWGWDGCLCQGTFLLHTLLCLISIWVAFDCPSREHDALRILDALARESFKRHQACACFEILSLNNHRLFQKAILSQIPLTSIDWIIFSGVS